MTKMTVGTAAAAPGEVARGHIKVGEFPHGAPIELPVVIVNGARPGKTLWVQNAIHGNEYCGTYIIFETLAKLDATAISGAVVALPVVNLPAFMHTTRGSNLDIYGGSDMNRVFPGKIDGTMTEQMAYHLFEAIKATSQALVDFHTAFMPNTRWSLYTKQPGEVGDTAERMAFAFGYDVILPVEGGLLATSAYMAAAREGIPGIIIEAAGKGPAFANEVVEDGAKRLRNVLRVLGIVDEPVVAYDKKPTVISDFAWVRSRRGGLFRPVVTCGDLIEEGQVIGHFRNLFGDIVEEAKAPKAGVVLNMHPGPLMASGETLIHIGLEPRGS